MQELADETDMKIEEVFIKYMDLQSEAVVETEKKLQDDMKALDEASQ